MKVLLVTLPGFGHICPTLPLVMRLRESGHEVAVASSPGVSAFIAEAGIPFFPIGPQWLESDFGHDGSSVILRSVSGVSLSEFMYDEVLPAQFRDLESRIVRWWPDVILSNEYEICGRLVAEKYSIPFVLLSSGPRLSHRMRMRLQGHIFASSKAKYGLSPENPLDYSFRWLHLCFSPDWYRFDDGSVFEEAENEFGICPEIYDGFSAWDAKEIDVRRGIVALCTFGTVFNKQPEIFRRIIGGVCDQVDTLLILAGEGEKQACSDIRSDKVQWVSGSLSNILLGADLCISHGGTSTLATALIQGKPSLILPQGADQIVNAIACTQNALGVSMVNTVLEGGNEMEGRIPLTSNSIRERFLSLIGDGRIRENCWRFKTSIEAMAKMGDAVKLIERLVGTGMPVLR